jgi:hypothetical protein
MAVVIIQLTENNFRKTENNFWMEENKIQKTIITLWMPENKTGKQ